MSCEPFHVVLVEPQIPPNTGNVIRLCANTGARLHLIGPMGFPLNDAKMRRAGLDYHERCLAQTHVDWTSFLDAARPPKGRSFGLTTKAATSVFDCAFEPGDWLFFGSETSGLSAVQLDWFTEVRLLRLPMRSGNRSLNLSNAVAVVAYEALRQTGLPTG